jgi:DNA-binding IclR family transcriptional regulator
MTVNTDKKSPTLGAIDKSFQVIETLKKMDGANLSELIDELGWSKSTVYSHLRTLQENEYIVYENNQYVLGFRFLELGEYVKDRKEIYTEIEPKIESLAEETGERVQFVTNEHGEAVYARIAEGEHSVSTGGKLGRRRTMLHATAAGKAILSCLSRETVEEIIDKKGLPERTTNTITDVEELFKELEEVRELGYALNNEEHITGLRAIAAPLEHPDEGVIGSISIAGPTHRIRSEKLNEEFPDLLLGIVNEIELNIRYG